MKEQPWFMFLLDQIEPDFIGPLEWISAYAGRATGFYMEPIGWASAQSNQDYKFLEMTRQRDSFVDESMSRTESAVEMYYADNRRY